MNVKQQEIAQVLNSHAVRSQRGDFRDLSKAEYTDFREVLNRLQSCKGKGGKQWQEVLQTAIGNTDFGETYDLAIDTPGGFWDKVIDYSQGLSNVQVVPTSNHTISSNELTLGTNGEDVFRPGVAGTDPGDTVTTDTAQRTFVPEEVIAIVDITDQVLEDNIEHGNLEQHILTMLASAAGNEWEKFAFNGVKVGTSNSDRGSVTGCFDGFLKQFDAAGNVVNATDYEDRFVSSIQENDKFLAAAKLLPTKYGNDGMIWMASRGIIHDWNAELAQRPTGLGDTAVQGGWWRGLVSQGYPFFHVPQLRTNHLVKGTGTVQASSPVDTDLDGIAKARQAAVTVTTVTNEANLNKYVIGTNAAGDEFLLHAENRVQSGAAAGSVITMSAALTYDHADAEVFTEYSTAPDADGTPCLLTRWDNLKIYSQRVMRIEPYRLPRSRTTAFVMTARWVPVVANPDAGVLLRDLKVRA